MKSKFSCFVLFDISFLLNILKLTSSENVRNPSGHINFGLTVGFNLDQASLDLIAKKYPIMRNIHGKPLSNLIPLVALASDIAKSLNSTLRAISYFNAKDLKNLSLSSPTIIFSVFLTDNHIFNKTWMHYWKRRIDSIPKGKEDLPFVLVTEARHLNFLYCDVIQSKYESPFRLEIFARSFDFYCWISFCCSFLIILVYVSLKTRKVFTLIIFILLSTLLSPGTSGLTTATKKLTIRLVWMISCMFLTNLYLGYVTSMVVQPNEPNVLANIQQLRESNYTLLYPTYSYYQSISNAAIETVNPFKLFDIQVVNQTIKKIDEKMQKFVEILTRKNSKQAFVHVWTLALHFADLARNHLENQKIKSEVTCHIGKSLIPVNSFNYLILPPNNDVVFRVYQNFFDTGIYRRWENEVIGLSISSRVQDRSKVKGPTKLADEDVSVTSLKLEGRISKLFLLWVIGLVICQIVFICEFKRKRVKFPAKAIIW